MWTENDCYIIRTNGTYTKTGDKKQTLQEIAEKVLSNIIKHKLPYGGDYPLDTTSYLTDNLSSGIDCSAYVSAVLYEFDKDMIGGIDKTIKNATNVLNFLNNTKEIK